MKKTSKMDFSVCAFDPTTIGDNLKGVQTRYPDLKTLPSWQKIWTVFNANVNRVGIVKYIFMMYQEKSPLLAISNLIERKATAARLAGLETVNGDFREYYKVMMAGDNLVINRMILDFCRLQKNPDFSEYVVYEEIFYRQMGITLNSTKPDDVAKAISNISTVKSKMSALKKTFLFSDDTKGLLRSFMEEASAESIKLRREDIAEALEEGIDPLQGYTPYGENYTKNFAPDINEKMYRQMKDTYGDEDVEEQVDEQEPEDIEEDE